MLEKFKTDVTNLGAEACLPSALSMEWLTKLLQSAEAMLEGPDGGTDGALVLAAILTILDASGRMDQLLRADETEQSELLGSYRIELALEMMHRFTDVKYEAATLQTIFTNRDVVTWREGELPGGHPPDAVETSP